MTVALFTNHTPGQFDFGLSAMQEVRAAKLNRESIVFDSLSQLAGGCGVRVIVEGKKAMRSP